MKKILPFIARNSPFSIKNVFIFQQLPIHLSGNNGGNGDADAGGRQQ